MMIMVMMLFQVYIIVIEHLCTRNWSPLVSPSTTIRLTSSPMSPAPQPPSPLTLFLFCQFVSAFFLFHIWMKSYNICFSPSDLCSLRPSRSIPVVTNSRISFFPWLTNIPVCVRMCVCVCVPCLLNSLIHQ